MAEFCLGCWNKIMKTADPPDMYLISKELDLCEECGELKPVIIRKKKRYLALAWLQEQVRHKYCD